jgi:hypothetical protein
MKIGLKTSLYPYRHFTEHLVDAFGKSPWDSDLNHETSSFSIRQRKNNTGASPATIHKQHEEVATLSYQRASRNIDASSLGSS